MNSKSILTIVLLVFVAASAGYLIHGGSKTPNADAEIVAPETEVADFTVYYFHNTKRCPTCNKIEARAHQAVFDNFAAELESGSLDWQMHNMEEPEYEHVAEEYQLIAQSVVLVDNRPGQNGRWKNLDKIWDLVWQEEQFLDYIKTEVATFMDAS